MKKVAGNQKLFVESRGVRHDASQMGSCPVVEGCSEIVFAVYVALLCCETAAIPWVVRTGGTSARIVDGRAL